MIQRSRARQRVDFLRVVSKWLENPPAGAGSYRGRSFGSIPRSRARQRVDFLQVVSEWLENPPAGAGSYQRALRIAQGQLKNLEGDAAAPIRLLVTARYAMGNFYRSQGDYLNAEKEFTESKGGGAMLMPADDPSLARSAGALASVLASRGDLEQAHQLCTWGVDRVITYCGTNDAEIAWIDDMMGRSYAFAGHYAKALPVYKHMLTVRVAALPPEHPDLADAHNRLASVLHKIDRNDDAVEHLRQALAIRTKALGPDHPYTARSRKNLEPAQGQHAAAP